MCSFSFPYQQLDKPLDDLVLHSARNDIDNGLKTLSPRSRAKMPVTPHTCDAGVTYGVLAWARAGVEDILHSSRSLYSA